MILEQPFISGNIMQHPLPRILRIATHVGALIPLVILIWDFTSGNLTANPIQAAEQRTGLIALILLLLSLACTPLNTIFHFRLALQRRRALGLYAFFYAALHLFIFAVIDDFGLDWSTLSEMVFQKLYILAGTASFVLLLALAVTSFRWSMKRMGKGWKRLHQLVYPAAVLVIIHFAWSAKGDLFRLNGSILQPLVYGGILVGLLALRLPPLRRWITRVRGRVMTTRNKATGASRPIQPSARKQDLI
jgi:methionine sulfoxide reductase heme-binding subunit